MFAQDKSSHLMFKGVPIDGTLKEYVSKLVDAGFVLMSPYSIDMLDDRAVLEGDFAGYKDCRINVITVSDIVYFTEVIFTIEDNWETLENNYNDIKSMIFRKYGKPDECVESFLGDSETDYRKMSCLENNKCKWFTIYKTSVGNVELSIEPNQTISSYGNVVLRYFDKINMDAVEAQAIDDL